MMPIKCPATSRLRDIAFDKVDAICYNMDILKISFNLNICKFIGFIGIVKRMRYGRVHNRRRWNKEQSEWF